MKNGTSDVIDRILNQLALNVFRDFKSSMTSLVPHINLKMGKICTKTNRANSNTKQISIIYVRRVLHGDNIIVEYINIIGKLAYFNFFST